MCLREIVSAGKGCILSAFISLYFALLCFKVVLYLLSQSERKKTSLNCTCVGGMWWKLKGTDRMTRDCPELTTSLKDDIKLHPQPPHTHASNDH